MGEGAGPLSSNSHICSEYSGEDGIWVARLGFSHVSSCSVTLHQLPSLSKPSYLCKTGFALSCSLQDD